MPTSGFENEFKDSLAKFRQQNTYHDIESNKDITFVNESLLIEVHSHILQQLNDNARMGVIDINQFKILNSNISDSIFIIIFVKNYETDEDLIDKDAFFTSSTNYATLMLTRVLGGRDREIVLRDIDSKQNKYIMGNK